MAGHMFPPCPMFCVIFQNSKVQWTLFTSQVPQVDCQVGPGTWLSDRVTYWAVLRLIYFSCLGRVWDPDSASTAKNISHAILGMPGMWRRLLLRRVHQISVRYSRIGSIPYSWISKIVFWHFASKNWQENHIVSRQIWLLPTKQQRRKRRWQGKKCFF